MVNVLVSARCMEMGEDERVLIYCTMIDLSSPFAAERSSLLYPYCTISTVLYRVLDNLFNEFEYLFTGYELEQGHLHMKT